MRHTLLDTLAASCAIMSPSRGRPTRRRPSSPWSEPAAWSRCGRSAPIASRSGHPSTSRSWPASSPQGRRRTSSRASSSKTPHRTAESPRAGGSFHLLRGRGESGERACWRRWCLERGRRAFRGRLHRSRRFTFGQHEVHNLVPFPIAAADFLFFFCTPRPIGEDDVPFGRPDFAGLSDALTRCVGAGDRGDFLLRSGLRDRGDNGRASKADGCHKGDDRGAGLAEHFVCLLSGGFG